MQIKERLRVGALLLILLAILALCFFYFQMYVFYTDADNVKAAELVIDVEDPEGAVVNSVESSTITVVDADVPLTNFENLPIYEVYKHGHPVYVSTELQWMIRNLSSLYGFREEYIFGMILAESTFNADASNNGCYGLAQINSYWLRSVPLAPYRITDDYQSRNLFNPEHNLLTLFEMWSYARDVYAIDITTEAGMVQLLYWHNTGGDPRYVTNWAYASRIFKYANELVEIEY